MLAENEKNDALEAEDKYKLEWTSADIFPELKNEYKVRVETIEADRGKILDRNGNILAGKQTASQIGFVPGKINEQTKQHKNSLFLD